MLRLLGRSARVLGLRSFGFAIPFGCLSVLTPAVVRAEGRYEPQVVIQHGDYRTDRAAFHTRLLKAGPSPQDWDKLVVPQGVEEIKFPSGKLQLRAWIGRPEEQRPRMPIVIFLHGGFAFGADDFAMAAPYRRAGFVAVTPILRGENGQAGNFSMFYDEVDDVLALADFMRHQRYVDPSRIFLAGHSAGATLALLAGMASTQFASVATFSASPDQILFTSGPPWNQIVPFDTTNPREFELRSPLAYATSLKSPTRLYFGSQEIFFRESTRRLVSIAKQASLDVEYKVMDGDHLSAVPASIQASITFFNAPK